MGGGDVMTENLVSISRLQELERTYADCGCGLGPHAACVDTHRSLRELIALRSTSKTITEAAQDLREEYLHLRRVVETAHDYLQGEFYAEALGVLDDSITGSPVETKAEHDNLIAALHLLAGQATSPIHIETARRAIRVLGQYSSPEEPDARRTIERGVAALRSMGVEGAINADLGAGTLERIAEKASEAQSLTDCPYQIDPNTL
jgi:hypothetical protein